MKWLLILLLLITNGFNVCAQMDISGIHSQFALHTEREKLHRSMYERTIRKNLSYIPDSENEYRFQSAFYTVTQFLIQDSIVFAGFDKILKRYDSLEWETRRSFLEAIYALNPKKYTASISKVLTKETHPKGVAMAALFVYRNDSTQFKKILSSINEKFPDYTSIPVLTELVKYMLASSVTKKDKLPDLSSLFAVQSSHRRKMIYSFQRQNRDYPGIAVIQGADGKFARDENGELIMIRQLARSGSSLPYFITNGNTPQGIYSIQGIGISTNQLIGPTPNLQMIMPFEKYWFDFFHEDADSTYPLLSYLDILPDSWRDYLPIQESFYAGKTGRTEIIAHGTTIDPAYFTGRSFYPISPTLGCLCAPENWNVSTGRLTTSEQFRLADTYSKIESDDGFFIVLNLDNKQIPVSRNEIEMIIRKFEESSSQLR